MERTARETLVRHYNNCRVQMIFPDKELPEAMEAVKQIMAQSYARKYFKPEQKVDIGTDECDNRIGKCVP